MKRVAPVLLVKELPDLTAASVSIEPHARGLNDLRPARDVSHHECGEFRGRAADRIGAQRHEFFLHVRRLQRTREFIV